MSNINWCVWLRSNVKSNKGMVKRQVKLLKPYELNKVLICQEYYRGTKEVDELIKLNDKLMEDYKSKTDVKINELNKALKDSKISVNAELKQVSDLSGVKDNLNKRNNLRQNSDLNKQDNLKLNNDFSNNNILKNSEDGEEKRNTMNLQGIMEKLNLCTTALNKGNTELKTLGLMKAQTEKAYRVRLAEEILKLKEEKYPATLIMELAKGNTQVAELRLQRDIAENSYYTCISAIENLRLEIDAIRSKLKWLRAELNIW